MTIQAGDVYWIHNLQSEIPHPYVVLQTINCDMIQVCAITSNRKKISIPGNVLLDIGEGNLQRLSIVEVTKVLEINKTCLGDSIGTLSQRRIQQIRAGIQFVQTTYFDHL